MIKSGAKIKASPNSRQDRVRFAKKFKVPRSAVLQIFLRSAHWSCYRELAKAGPLLSRIFENRAFLHLRIGFSFLILQEWLLAPCGEEAQTGACPAKCESSHWREWDKAWNSTKGLACFGRNSGLITRRASLFATFLAMKKVEEIFLLTFGLSQK